MWLLLSVTNTSYDDLDLDVWSGKGSLQVRLGLENSY